MSRSACSLWGNLRANIIDQRCCQLCFVYWCLLWMFHLEGKIPGEGVKLKRQFSCPICTSHCFLVANLNGAASGEHLDMNLRYGSIRRKRNKRRLISRNLIPVSDKPAVITRIDNIFRRVFACYSGSE
jgi:hypothetical protein